MKPIAKVVVMLVIFAAFVIPASGADDAAATFKSKCAMCHGADATGKTPMGARLNIRDLTSPEVQKQPDAELTSVISKGRNKMTPFGDKHSAEQINALVKYIRTLAKK